MRKLLTLCLFLSISFYTLAQQPQMPSGSLYGRIVDSVTGKGISAASVQLLQTKMDTVTKKPVQSVAAIMFSSANGEFRFENIPVMGRYTFVVTNVGYKPYSRPFGFIDPQAMKKAAASGTRDMSALLGALDKDLGNIKLANDDKTLSNVTVTAGAPAVKLGIDRKVYAVDNNLTAAGGNASDVMKNIPSVNVDIDGNISVRNSTPQIFVDGRPTTLTLDQIPADQIESVEVITNPSAKFDAASGSAGIINIVLKKAKRVGYSGNVRAGIDQRGKPNFGINANLRQSKFNVFANVNYGQRKSISDGTTDRYSYNRDTTEHLYQTDRNINQGRFMFARAGVDYFLDNRNTLSLSGLAMGGKFKSNVTSNLEQNSWQNASPTALIDDLTMNRVSNAAGHFQNFGGTLSFLHNFPKNGHQITADGTLTRSKNGNNTNIFSQSNPSRNDATYGTFNQQQASNGQTDRLTIQTDYTNPINDNTKFEAGLRLNQTKTDQAIGYRIQYPDSSNTSWFDQRALNTNFNYTDRVLAGYLNYTSQLSPKFGYQLGLRAESSSYSGLVHKTIASSGADSLIPFKIQYPISLFPSAYLTYHLSTKEDLQFNYSRKINRPGFFQLFPFIDYTDPLNLNRGNSDLRPEFVSSFELAYSNNFDRNNNLILSAYYKYTNNLITRYQSREINPANNDSVIVNTYLNANSGYVTGFEAITKNMITKWWDITGNINIYTSKINDNTIQTAAPIASWFGKLTNNFKLTKQLSLQVSGDYNSKTVLAAGGRGNSGGGGMGFMGGSVSGNAQGYSRPSYGVDAAIKYDFLKNNAASISLSGSDLFKTRVSDVYTYTNYFNQRAIRVRDQQFFRLTFSWRFGKFDASLFKRKNTKAEQESMQSGMQGAQ